MVEFHYPGKDLIRSCRDSLFFLVSRTDSQGTFGEKTGASEERHFFKEDCLYPAFGGGERR
jgi:hypothetical protein